ncbi:NADPH--cytochrome P450 reductase [Scaptodrosophila lebanonensis]|uniref:NADPH--cytochrome P450 reductase n=1 Tax=Drosophila lebanonensis TaxID=7225 RepID=A0A6J2TN69_DROLE|nr:NADPH--cytochrome P450 reductase [Scaptodrosophila lebanonensis]XP_030377484.1 NADPH--cytochrome P450 reductase [Scaptodrosophila lebanonensis]
MASEKPIEATGDEPFLGLLDVALLAVLIAGAAWYFLRSRKKEEEPIRSYSIQPTTVSTSSAVENSFIKKLKTSGRSLVVFYGSQTGTGEEFAGRLAKEGIRYRLKGMVADPEECDMEELLQLKDISNSLAVFCLATYGEGDPTDNAMEFYEWINNGDVDLTGLNYAVFGLGNKTYEHYNKVAIHVDKRLEELGATRVFELGLGDDDANIEDDFITWKDRFWPAVCDFFGIEGGGEEVLIRQYRLLEQPDVLPDRIYTGEIARLHSMQNQRPPFDAKNPFLAPIRVNRELHKGGGRSCMHIELNIDGSKMRYDAGDHVAMYPINDKSLVEKLGQLCNADLDTVFSLINTDTDSSKKHPFPCPTTYRTALTHYLEITAIPRTHILKELAEYCSDEADKQLLRSMASITPEGKEKYQSWIQDACRNIVHILEDIKTCRPPIDHVCELLPRLQPRYYSISSSAKLHPTDVHVTAVLVEYKTPTGRVNKGVATTYLKNKQPQDGGEEVKVPVFIRKSQFRLPTKPETPIIMVGPGTGLAPFRGFLQERQFLRDEGKTVGESVLYFGCRKRSEDYIYEAELEEWEKKGTLTLKTAFSRDQEKKVYVQHLLEQDADLIWNVIGENKGHFYICGDAKNMAVDVRNILVKILSSKGNMSEADAVQYLKRMEAQKRYSADVWS